MKKSRKVDATKLCSSSLMALLNKLKHLGNLNIKFSTFAIAKSKILKFQMSPNETEILW
jgi:hypothetical protein